MARYVGLDRQAIAAVGLVAVLVIGGGLAFAFVPSIPDPGEDPPTQSGADGTGDTGGTATDDTVNRSGEAGRVGQFDFDVLAVDSCGTTCRNVTSQLVNVGNDTARRVEVRTRIYTGGDLVWSGHVTVGSLGTNESYREVSTVDLSYFEAAKVKNNGGNVTIVTTISSAEAEHTVTRKRDVTG